MQIHMLYFGLLKEVLGCEREALELDGGACAGDVIRLLRTRASNREDGLWASLAVAVNQEYVSSSTELHDMDELALLPPVSGGLMKG